MSSEYKISKDQSDSPENSQLKDTPDSNLISFEGDAETKTQTRDINTKITSLEDGLQQLNSQLGSINASVEEGLDRLGDSDTDLTAKVSETYKRLGEIDNAYKALMDISVKLDTDILKITQNVSDVAAQSLTGLKTLEETSVAKNNELAERNQQVVNRVEALVENSRTTNDLLHESIRMNTENMLSLEKKLVAEIETLADNTQTNVDDIEMQLAANKARIIKMQKVDEAIVRRATTLEITSSELTQKSAEMAESIQQLEDGAVDLTEKVVDLMVHTQKLQDDSDKHSGLISTLQTNFSDMAASMLAMSKLENRHFKTVMTILFLIVVSLVGITLYQSNKMEQVAILSTQQTDRVEQAVTEEITGLQIQDKAATEKLTTLDTRISSLGSDVKSDLVDLNQQLRQEVSRLNHQVAGINDQVLSLDSRVSDSVMFERIGDDNILHGEQWLAAQPAGNYVIRIVDVQDKAALYEIAQRYNYYLTDTVSYLAVEQGEKPGYTLLYGNYADESAARNAMEQLPRIGSGQPSLVTIGQLAL